MNRFFTVTSYALVVCGLLSVLGGMASTNLTPLVLGGVLVGLGGVLLTLMRLEARLSEAAPALETLARNARYLALKESSRANLEPAPAAAESAADEFSPGVRNGAAGAVGAYPESGDFPGPRA